jgi:hypothetical protein
MYCSISELKPVKCWEDTIGERISKSIEKKKLLSVKNRYDSMWIGLLLFNFAMRIYTVIKFFEELSLMMTKLSVIHFVLELIAILIQSKTLDIRIY